MGHQIRTPGWSVEARWMSAHPKAALFDQLDTNGDDEVNLQEFQAAQVRDLVALLPPIQPLVPVSQLWNTPVIVL